MNLDRRAKTSAFRLLPGSERSVSSSADPREWSDERPGLRPQFRIETALSGHLRNKAREGSRSPIPGGAFGGANQRALPRTERVDCLGPAILGQGATARAERRALPFGFWTALAAATLAIQLTFVPVLTAKESPPLPPKDVQHVLSTYCYDCHGDGMEKGKVSFDQFTTREEMLGRRDLWMAAVKNLRAGIMPPEKKPRPSQAEQKALEDWVKAQVFQIDPRNLDPGRVTLRRLNRVEYRNTIRDLTGFDFNVEEELPPDDTGYGFDTIGDVLSMSPLLLEKYMRAAEKIAIEAVPRSFSVAPEEKISGEDFRSPSGSKTGQKLRFSETNEVAHTFQAKTGGSYKLALDLEVRGPFEFDPGKCDVAFRADDQELWHQEFGWQNGKKFHYEFDWKWEAGDHVLTLQVHAQSAQAKPSALEIRVREVRISGPLGAMASTRPKNFDRFFWKDPPKEPEALKAYAREVLARFARKAYRRPVEPTTVDRLLAIAEATYTRPGKTLGDGIAQALIPLLASPRFLFRVEAIDPTTRRQKFPLIDDHSLASRLSYFLWSTMPDEELLTLADHHELRKELGAQVKRMADDPRSQALVENFVGQWLQVRDLEGININEQIVLARDRGEDRDRERRIRRFRELNAIPTEQRSPEQAQELQKLIEERKRRAEAAKAVELDNELRRAMREETQMGFAYLIRENRSVLELVDSDYTFLNERLAHHYGITNVTGKEMRRVTLPPESPRGGVLTDGAVLVVTSNPTRTSPVKRGLFILDNVLGMPPPPPPANIPPLEASEKDVSDHQPTLRETLEIHRGKPLCNSCHNRMDPLGLALENFNALGMWREQERGAPIDAGGKLITGETFTDIRQIKQALVTQHRRDFYRCLTEKLMTFAIGRGPEYYDLETVDRIVDRLDEDGGHFSTLLLGVIDSVPFQRTRPPSTTMAQDSHPAKSVIK
jgi:hypothetical protein